MTISRKTYLPLEEEEDITSPSNPTEKSMEYFDHDDRKGSSRKMRGEEGCGKMHDASLGKSG